MRWRYDQRLIEAVVFEAVQRGGPGDGAEVAARYHRLVDPLYDLPESPARERAFFDAHWTMFVELALDQVFAEALRSYRHVAARVPEGVVAMALSSRDEGAELFVREGGTLTLVVRVRAQRFSEPQGLSVFYHHELAHIDDLLDPAFGYQKDDAMGSASTLEGKLVRGRYRILWAIGIDGRIARRGLAPLKSRDERHAEFCQSFPFLDESTARLWFDRLWHGAWVTHPQLLELAQRPRESTLRATGGEAAAVQGDPRPQDGPGRQGLSCPLCGFVTHAWSESQALSDHVREQIRADFPSWAPSEGLCERCAEVYGTMVS